MEGWIESGTVPAVLGPELADLLAALITVVAVIGLLSFWRPSSGWHFERRLTPAPVFRPPG